MKAFLPIKSHSERVPNKNFRLLKGVPLYRWILSSLLTCESIDEICIDTDSRDINLSNLGKHPRIVIKQRKSHLIGDDVSMNLLIEDYLESLHEPCDIFMTHVTNPFLSGKTIKTLIDRYYALKLEGFDSLFSVTEFRARFFDSKVKPINHRMSELKKTQDLEPWYMENSCAYVFSKDSFANSNSRIGNSPSIFVTPLLESIDIDTLAEWELASVLAQSIRLSPVIPSC